MWYNLSRVKGKAKGRATHKKADNFSILMNENDLHVPLV